MELRFSLCPVGYALEIPMSNHSRRATLRTASGAQMEHAGQKMAEFEHGDGGSVNMNFEVADMTRPLVAVGELQRRGHAGRVGTIRRQGVTSFRPRGDFEPHSP